MYLATEAKIPPYYKDVPSMILGWKSSLQSTAIQIQKECAIYGWDGYDAEPITQQSLVCTLSLISNLPEISEPDIVPEPGGSIGLEWRSGKTKIMSMAIQDESLIYAAILGPHNKHHGEEPFRPNELPRSIKEILFTHFGK